MSGTNGQYAKDVTGALKKGENMHGTQGLQIRVLSDTWAIGVEMVFHERDFENNVVNIGKLIMEPYSAGTSIPIESRINIEDKTAQSLMDDLWKYGFRPTEGKGSAGALAATEKHLKDMRMLVSKCMKTDLK